MIDEWNNDCPYDFKNIKFKRNISLSDSGLHYISTSGSEAYCYTFSIIFSGLNSIEDNSICSNYNDNNRICVYSNVIGRTNEINEIQKLNNNIFLNDTGNRNCYYNILPVECYGNSFNRGCFSNSFGERCTNNTFGEMCYGNAFGKYCSNNELGNGCYGNAFGHTCIGNCLGNNCLYNVFENNCSNNILGNSCTNNVFGNFCTKNTLNDESIYNTIVIQTNYLASVDITYLKI